MSKKSFIILLLTVAALLMLPACQRSASQSPLATPTTSNPFNVARPTGLSLVEMYGTQTALALGPQTVLPSALTALPSPTLAGGQPTPNLLTPGALPSPTGFLGTPATPTVQIVVPTATPGRPASYTLQSGEYPYCIARRFNLNPQELLTLNNLADGQLLQPGFTLQIPQTGNPWPGVQGSRALHSHPATYTVSTAEETIYHVACYFGDLDPTAIAAANSLLPPYALRVGQVLNIP